MNDEPINHTKRYLYVLNTVGNLSNIPELAGGLYKALHAEHDWVIRLDERLIMAQQRIIYLEERCKELERDCEK